MATIARLPVIVRPTHLEDLEPLNNALNLVCAERKYLATVEGFPLSGHKEFLANMIENGMPHVVALDGQVLVGWCDISAGPKEGFSHVGHLGMGVVKSHRSQGIGDKLLAACLDRAREYGFEKIELEVFSDNPTAIMLYQKHGFTVEGLKKNSRKIDGFYQDILLMGLFLDGTQ